MLTSQLHATAEILPVAGLDRLAEHLPTAWVEEALAATGSASIWRRRLPAEQVVWLIIALALYRRQSMPEVLATLDLALPSATEAPRQQECGDAGSATPRCRPSGRFLLRILSVGVVRNMRAIGPGM